MSASDKEVREMVARARKRLDEVMRNVSTRNGEYQQKREQALHIIVRDVVLAYYGKIVDGFDAIVRQIKAHFL